MKPRITYLNSLKQSKSIKGLYVYEIHYLNHLGEEIKTKAFGKDSEDAIRRVKQDEVFPRFYFGLAAFYAVFIILIIAAGALTLYYAR